MHSTRRRSVTEPTLRKVLLGAYVVLVLVATLAPISPPSSAPTISDKLVHVGMFGGLAILLYWNLAVTRVPHALAVVASTVAFAAAIELAQLGIPYRSGDLWDLAAGALGAVAGALVAAWWAGRHRD